MLLGIEPFLIACGNISGCPTLENIVDSQNFFFLQFPAKL
jgi:hypothetical protein